MGLLQQFCQLLCYFFIYNFFFFNPLCKEMCNQLTEFKTLLKILPLEEQISEINDKITEVRNEKCPKHSHNHAILKLFLSYF